MLEILRGEGWDLKERELTKLRKEQNLLLRERNRNGHPKRSEKRKRDDAFDEQSDDGEQQIEDGEDTTAASGEPALPNMAPEILAKRQARQAKLLAESEERLKAGTRRRRTKVWSGLPPDPAAPPRYPSELTMEECKGVLGLDKQQYHSMRDLFEGICRTNNIVKKTLCSADTWSNAKAELISRVPHLQSIFYGPNAAMAGQTQQPMAFELICMDVTKKIRTVGTRVTITEAKSFLGLTPQEARDARAAFDAILKEDYFVSKLEVPREHWDGLKTRWVEGSPLLQQKLSGGVTDHDYGMKLKCIESIAADVQKRHRDQQTKNDPTHLTKSIDPTRNPYASTPKPTNTMPTPPRINTAPPPPLPPTINRGRAPFPSGKSMGPPPASNAHNFAPSNSTPHNYNHPPASAPSESQDNGITDLATQALSTATQAPFISYTSMANMQIDPTLLQAASLPPYEPTISSPSAESIPIYFRLSPLSSIHSHPKVWLCTLNPPYTVSTVKESALGKVPLGQAARCMRVEGVAPESEGGGRWGIDEDDELEAYLDMVGEGRGKATFVVEIV